MVPVPAIIIAPIVTVTAAATALVSTAVTATAMGTQIDRDKENGWGRSHLPPHGRGGNLFRVLIPCGP